MHTVTGQELDAVASLSNSVHLTFFGLCFGATISLSIVISTVSIPDPKTYAAFMALTAVSVILSSYFGIRALIDYRASRRKLKEIKREE